MGLRRFMLRGKEKVHTELGIALYCPQFEKVKQ